MATTSNTRTLRAYVADLLEYPCWVIERDVDFTECPYGGHYNAFLPECGNCRFGRSCCWLNQRRTPQIRDLTLDELLEALGGAIEYLQLTHGPHLEEHSDTQEWMREARRFLRSRRE